MTEIYNSNNASIFSFSIMELYLSVIQWCLIKRIMLIMPCLSYLIKPYKCNSWLLYSDNVSIFSITNRNLYCRYFPKMYSIILNSFEIHVFIGLRMWVDSAWSYIDMVSEYNIFYSTVLIWLIYKFRVITLVSVNFDQNKIDIFTKIEGF